MAHLDPVTAISSLTIIETARDRYPLWKVSALVVIYHGLEDGVIDAEREHLMASDMAEAAGTTYVRMDHNGAAGDRILL